MKMITNNETKNISTQNERNTTREINKLGEK